MKPRTQLFNRDLQKPEMKNQLSSSSDDDDEFESSRLACFWWRSAAKFDECVKIKVGIPNVSSLTPRIRLLREMERLGLIAFEGLNELRHRLLVYRSGDFWVPTGGITKEEMEIPPMNTILLVGVNGAGKSTLVNLMYSVLGCSGLIPFAQTTTGGSTSTCTTMYLEEHNVVRSLRSGFCVYDSRGFSYDQMGEGLEELASWMTDGIHHKQLCMRSGDAAIMKGDDVETFASRSSSKFVKRTVNCVMVVANLSEIYKAFKEGDSKSLDATKQIFCSPALRKRNDENPILILTHGDLLTTEERIEGRIKICEHLGISETTGVFDIVCLTGYGFLAEESDPITAYAVSEAVYRALLISDRSHLPKKNYLDWALLILSWVVCFLGALFALLADLCSKLGQKL